MAELRNTSLAEVEALIQTFDISNNEEKDEKSAEKVFKADNMSAALCNAKYAVRGDIVQRAYQIKANLSKKGHKHPFNKVISCNIGNPQAFCSPPITFHRQVLACIMYPPLMADKPCKFATDVIIRAKRLLDATAHQNIGAYTTSRGLLFVRQSVANYLKTRDGFAGDVNHIFLTNGASAGVTHCLRCLIATDSDGILIPLPQYPLYSATITLLSGVAVPYELDEENAWAADLQSIEAAINNARKKGINCKAIVVINPGNPTGQCMTQKVIEGIIAIAAKYNIVILADEVYQENIYYKDTFPFVSFRKCLLSSSMRHRIELISFHSTSKGIFGECGLRGGYMDFVNVDVDGLNMIVKLASISLCPNTIGQCMVDLMVNPPKAGDESFQLFRREYEEQYESLQERAKIVTSELNGIDGISCSTILGAMYAFPTIELPDIVVLNVLDAYKMNVQYNSKPADFLYCMEFLERFGIVFVPGSGFGQKDGTFHFRTTILPPKDQIQEVVKSLATFHKGFIARYS